MEEAHPGTLREKDDELEYQAYVRQRGDEDEHAENAGEEEGGIRREEKHKTHTPKKKPQAHAPAPKRGSQKHTR
jgi:hypothetical protein